MLNKLQNLYPSKEYDTLRDLLGEITEKFPENNAFIVKPDKSKKEYKYVTYKDLSHEVNALGSALIDYGLKDKRIAVISPNRYEWMTSYLAVVNGVGMVVPLDKGLANAEIHSLIQRSGVSCVIFSKEYYEFFKELSKDECCSIEKYICMDETEEFEKLSDTIEYGKKLLEDGKRDYLEAKIDREKPLIMLFTSGTTSRSKGVLLCQRNIMSNIYGMCCCQKFYSTDVNMAFLPFHHTFGCVAVLMFLAHGATNVFCDGLKYVSNNLKEYGVTVFVCVPLIIEAMHKKILQTAKKQGKEGKLRFGLKLSRLLMKIGIDKRRELFSVVHEGLGGKVRYIISGASAINPQVAKEFNDFGITTVQGYGLTETSPVLCAENVKLIRSGSVGLPLCNIKAKIDSPDERGIGEIVVSGPNVMLGYFEDEDATNEVIKDGWFYTGDLGKIDKDGVVYITGRKKNVIVLKNGKNVYPEEIETVINNLPYVEESIVYGAPKGDDLIISANVVYNKDYFRDKSINEIEKTIKEGIAEVNANMAKHQYIKNISITDEPMEKTTTAKIKRYKALDSK